MKHREIGNLSGDLSYIDIFKSGNTIGISSPDGRVQTGIEVVRIIEQCGNIIGMSYDEDSLQMIFRFDSDIALKVYGEKYGETKLKISLIYKYDYDKIYNINDENILSIKQIYFVLKMS